MDIQANSDRRPVVQKCPEVGCEFETQYAYSLRCHKIVHDVLKIINPDLANTLLGSNFGIVEQDPVQFKLPEEMGIKDACCVDSNDVNMPPENSDSDLQGKVDRDDSSSSIPTDIPIPGNQENLALKRKKNYLSKRAGKASVINTDSGAMLGAKIMSLNNMELEKPTSNVTVTNSINQSVHSDSIPHDPPKKRGRKPKTISSIPGGGDNLLPKPAGSDLTCFKFKKARSKNGASGFRKKTSPKKLAQNAEVTSALSTSADKTRLNDNGNGSTEGISLKNGCNEKTSGSVQTRVSEDRGSSKVLTRKSKISKIRRSFAPIKGRNVSTTASSSGLPSKSDTKDKSSDYVVEALEAQPFNSFDLTKLNAHDITNRSRKAQYEYVCIICNKFMKYRHHFIYHAISHSGERPFSCKFCNKSYTQHHNLTVHLTKSHITEVTSASQDKTE